MYQLKNYKTSSLRRLCAEVHDAVFLYVDMCEKQDLSNAITSNECMKYEIARVKHAQKLIEMSVQQFKTDPDAQKDCILFEQDINPLITECLCALDSMLGKLESDEYENEDEKEADILQSSQDIATAFAALCTNLQTIKLPEVKPRWADLTDAGPGVGVSNFSVRFRDAEMARLLNSDYRVRCHRSRDDSGQGEAERTNSAIGDAVVDGATIEWEREELFHGMTDEQIQAMTIDEFHEYDKQGMERNAWLVAQEVTERIDDAKAPSGYITAYLSKPTHMLFSESVFAPQASMKPNQPGYHYHQKITNFISMHYKTGELFTEYLKGSCADQNGQLCDYCHEHKFVGPVASRIPQPMPDRENPGHYMDVFDTPSMNGDSSRQADDYLPRAQIKIRFREGVLSASNEEAIRAFSREFAVKVEFVQIYVNHLHHLQCKEEMRQRQRDMARGERKQMHGV